MARQLGAAHRMCRRLAAPVCGRPNCPALRRPAPPITPGRRRRPLTPYLERLLEKQKVKALYGIGEWQLRRYVGEVRRGAGPYAGSLLVLVERRLDNIVRRLGFATTIAQARQLVANGHVLVNGACVDRPAYGLQAGDEVEIAPGDLGTALEALAEAPDVPAYVQREDGALRGVLRRLPERAEITHAVDVDDRLVVEYYAR